MDIIEISGVIKEYAWGNTTFIADFLGMEPSAVRRAELWWSTHSDGESCVVGSGQGLDSFLKEDPLHWYGQDHLAVYGPRLPLLLKVLAIDKPLSLQVHPTGEQAQRGWDGERAIRERLPKELWNYKDANGKPEMAYALTPTTVMCGLRPVKTIRAMLQRLLTVGYGRHFAFLEEEMAPDHALHRLLKTIYSLEEHELRPLLSELVESVREEASLPRSSDGIFLTEADIILLLADEYPADPGLFAPLLLNLLHLERGEALYLEPRTLHAYVKGDLIELMSASDNVLRAGLTTKKVDVRELLAVVETSEQPIERAPVLVGSSGRLHILTPTEDFHLMVLKSGHYAISERRSIELLLVAEGTATFEYGGVQHTLTAGRCYVVAASVANYTLDVDGLVFAADVPR